MKPISKMIKYRILVLLSLLWNQTVFLNAQVFHGNVVVDGFTDEWSGCLNTLEDATEDGNSLDMKSFSVTNDDRYLYIRLQFASPIHLGHANSLYLELDTDNDPQTGYRVNGIGAELGWHFGGRYGYFKLNSQAEFVSHGDIEFVYLPSTSAEEYEMAISLHAKVIQNEKLFRGDTVAILFWEKQNEGDLMPDAGKVYKYVLQKDSAPKFSSLVPERFDPEALRLMTWNVFNDGLTDTIRQPVFEKVFKTLNPDVIVLNECWNSGPDQLAPLFNRWIPWKDQKWNVKKLGEGNVIVSKYEILEEYEIYKNHNISAFLLKTGTHPEDRILVINCHLSCCDNESDRIDETQALMSFLKADFTILRNGNYQLKHPVIMAGDFNLVDTHEPYINLTTGVLQPMLEAERKSSPWFADLRPRQTDRPMAYTWRDYSKIFSPSRLDYIFYTPDYLRPVHSFVLTLYPMPEYRLKKYGLQRTDLRTCSDHLPLVADFRFITTPKKK